MSLCYDVMRNNILPDEILCMVDEMDTSLLPLETCGRFCVGAYTVTLESEL